MAVEKAREGLSPLKAARPAEATPGTHLCSGGKPVAKKNVQGDYGTYIPFSPTLEEKGGVSTRHHFPSLPRATSTRHRFNCHPLPPTTSRGLWAMCAQPTHRTQLPAHAPLDPEDAESQRLGAGTRRALSHLG